MYSKAKSKVVKFAKPRPKRGFGEHACCSKCARLQRHGKMKIGTSCDPCKLDQATEGKR